MTINYSNAMRDYERTLHSIYAAADSKSRLSLGEWCSRTRATVMANKVIQDELRGKYESEKSLYSRQENDRRWSELQTEQKAFNDTARARIEADLDNVLTAKGAAFSKAMAAPSEEAVRLLQTLQMRQNISAAEISATVEHLAGNLQALSVLSEIAGRNEVAFPKLNTDFLSTEQETREAASQLLDDLLADKPTYWGSLFMHETGNNGRLAPFVNALDSPNYLACDVTQIVDKPAEGEADAVTETV